MGRELICLAVLLMPIQAQDGWFPLEAVSLKGTALSQEFVLEIAGLHIGAPVDKRAIEAGCSKLRESGIFGEIGYSYAPGPKHGYILTLTVADQSGLSDATIDIPSVDENELWEWLSARYPSFNRKAPGNDAGQKFIARKLEERLGPKLEGQHIVARMESEQNPRPRMIVSFQPETLPLVASMTFNGQHEFTSEELVGLMWKVVADRGLTDRSFREAVELNLRRAYEERGMYRVRFPSIVSRREPDSKIAFTTTIEEGAKFTLGEVYLIGDSLPKDSMLKAAKFRMHQTANWTEIQQGIWELERPVKRTGYFHAAAKPERVFHDAPPVLDIKISFDLGPLYHFGQLRVTGLAPDLEARLRKMWKLQPGDPFDYDYPRDVFRDFFQVVDSRQFKKFNVAMQAGAGQNVMDFLLVFEPR